MKIERLAEHKKFQESYNDSWNYLIQSFRFLQINLQKLIQKETDSFNSTKKMNK